MSDHGHGRFLFVGNDVCLDFINTEIIDAGEDTDRLVDIQALIAWLSAADLLNKREAAGALRRWDERERADIFQQAVALRTALRTMVDRIVQGRPVPEPSIDAINEVLRKGLGYSQVVRITHRYERQFHRVSQEPASLLVPIAEAALGLLTSANHSLIKKCRNPACILYFHDTSKNHARNWCSMSLCGNRMKVAAHYRRKYG